MRITIRGGEYAKAREEAIKRATITVDGHERKPKPPIRVSTRRVRVIAMPERITTKKARPMLDNRSMHEAAAEYERRARARGESVGFSGSYCLTDPIRYSPLRGYPDDPGLPHDYGQLCCCPDCTGPDGTDCIPDPYGDCSRCGRKAEHDDPDGAYVAAIRRPSPTPTPWT